MTKSARQKLVTSFCLGLQARQRWVPPEGRGQDSSQSPHDSCHTSQLLPLALAATETKDWHWPVWLLGLAGA